MLSRKVRTLPKEVSRLQQVFSTTVKPLQVVSSHNEFDPLEEVIVGRVEGSAIPEWHVSGKAVWPEKWWNMYKTQAGQPFPADLMRKGVFDVALSNVPQYINAFIEFIFVCLAAWELDNFAKILEAEGVKVRRPEVGRGDFSQGYETPDFKCKNGLYAAMPRDVLMVVGNEIIEAPMAWRSRYFEFRPFRKLIKEYFHAGAKWTAAPKPQMSDDLYVPESEFKVGVTDTFVTTEFEPIFDAAEFTRIGKDIFVQRSQVTNNFGIEWMRRHLGPEYNIHVLDFQDKNAMHIDGTFIPLGPGKLLVNPKRPCITGVTQKKFSYLGIEKEYKLPEMFKGWDIFVAQTPLLSSDHPLFFTSPWTASCNIIMLDHAGLFIVPRSIFAAGEIFNRISRICLGRCTRWLVNQTHDAVCVESGVLIESGPVVDRGVASRVVQ